MTKTEYAEYLQSEHWQQRRKLAIAAASRKCQRCDLPRWLASLVYDQDLHVHHLNYQNVGNEQPADLEVLCRRCHEIETFGRSGCREIMQVNCPLCPVRHYDPYSDYCDACRVLLSKDDDAPPLAYRIQWWDREFEQPIWVRAISDAIIYFDLSIDDLLTVIADAEPKRKEIRGRIESSTEFQI